MVRVLIDTDIGSDVDDALAVSLAARSPELDVVGVTTVYGDVNLRSRIARKILDLAGRSDIPVASGIGMPLLREKKAVMFGHEGKGFLKPDEMNIELRPIHAVHLIVSEAMKGELILVTLGSLTNIAAAIIMEPRIIETIKALVVMGGATNPESAEMDWNTNCDPEATRLVLNSGISTTLIPIDLTMRQEDYFTERDMKRIKDADTPLTDALSDLMYIWLEKQKELRRSLFQPKEMTKVWLHDPLTLMSVIEEDLFKMQNARIEIAIVNGVLRTIPRLSEGVPMQVAVEADFEAFKDKLISRITA